MFLFTKSVDPNLIKDRIECAYSILPRKELGLIILNSCPPFPCMKQQDVLATPLLTHTEAVFSFLLFQIIPQ